MQSVSSKIWTRVAVSISYDDNHYTTSTHLGDSRRNTESAAPAGDENSYQCLIAYLRKSDYFGPAGIYSNALGVSALVISI